LREVALQVRRLIAKFNTPSPVTNPDEEAIRQVSVAENRRFASSLMRCSTTSPAKDLDELRNKENQLHASTSISRVAAPGDDLQDSPRGYEQKVFVRGQLECAREDSHGHF